MPQPITSKYLIHSLVVESSINLTPLEPIDCLNSHSKEADIKVVLIGNDQEEVNHFSGTQASTNNCWIDIEEIAIFHIQNGNTIEIKPHPNAPEQSILLYLFGSIMAVCLYQRGLLVLHANAIEIGGTAVLLAGDSGVGKSTTAAIFHQKGFNVLSDDIVVVNTDAKAMGGFPQIKLFQSTLDQLNISSKNLTPISAQKGKFSFPLTQKHNQNKRTISAIYILSTANEKVSKDFILSPINGIQRFKNLIKNTYRNELIDGLNIKDQHLTLCAHLSKKIHLMSIVRPESYFNGHELVDTILTDLNSNNICTTTNTLK
ncbi:MAG: hypothetical protein ACRBEE_06250 [Arenicella sp.]